MPGMGTIPIFMIAGKSGEFGESVVSGIGVGVGVFMTVPHLASPQGIDFIPSRFGVLVGADVTVRVGVIVGAEVGVSGALVGGSVAGTAACTLGGSEKSIKYNSPNRALRFRMSNFL